MENNWYDTKPDLVTATGVDTHSVALALLCLTITIRPFVVFVEELVMLSSAFLTPSFALTGAVFVAEHRPFSLTTFIRSSMLFLRGLPPSVAVLGRCLSATSVG